MSRVDLPVPQVTPGFSLKQKKAFQKRYAKIMGGFLKGPIPLPWLRAAGRIPGKALTVAVVIQFLAGVQKSKSGIKLSMEELRKYGISRYSAYRGLQKLENLRLIKADRRRGRAPLVTIIENPN